MDSRLSAILQDKGKGIHSVSKTMGVCDCAKTLTEYRVGALLVMESEKLEGIISERDIIRYLVNCNFNVGQTTVAEIMTKDVITVPPTMTVTEAMRIVTEKRFRHLPVTEGGKIVGIISIGDLTRWAMLAQEKEIDSLNKYIHGQ